MFRAPKHLDCRSADVDDPVTYTCKAGPDQVKAGFLPDMRVDVQFHYCGSSCSRQETDAFLRSAPDRARTSWTKADDSTYYAAGAFGGDDRYRMAMKRHWGRREKSTNTWHVHLLWVRAEVPKEHAATAQRIVNDMFTQTGGFDEGDHP